MTNPSQKEIVQEVDKVLTDLSTEFNVPKINYCIFKTKILKRLDKWDLMPESPGVFTVKASNYKPPFMFDACFVPDHLGTRKGTECYFSFLSKNDRHVSKKAIIHEFFHYKHYVECGYDWSGDKESLECRNSEEKRTETETQRYMRKQKDKIE